jgi:predicted HD phosphohydrolase
MTEQATFTKMRDATAADYEIIHRYEDEFLAGLPDRVLAAVEALGEGGVGGYAVSRLEHSLQSATRAERDGRDEQYVVACLVHDIGDGLAPHTHGSLAADVLRPFVSERLTWIVEHHPVFQQHYYGAAAGLDPDARERYRGHQFFDDTVEFCERYDECCFDPDYPSLPLERFVPALRRVFSQEPFTATDALVGDEAPASPPTSDGR